MEGGESPKVHDFYDDFKQVRHQYIEQRRATFGISPPQSPTLNNSEQFQNNSEKNYNIITNTLSSSDQWEFSVNIEDFPSDVESDLSECYNSETFYSNSEVSSIESSPSPPPSTPAYSPTDTPREASPVSNVSRAPSPTHSDLGSPPPSRSLSRASSHITIPPSPSISLHSRSRSSSRSTSRASPVKRPHSRSPSPSSRSRSVVSTPSLIHSVPSPEPKRPRSNNSWPADLSDYRVTRDFDDTLSDLDDDAPPSPSDFDDTPSYSDDDVPINLRVRLRFT